ncbi:DUF2075 domain-containing protein [Cellulomonas hominis]|uniref:DUF2075 domain-containing protein n=1 Tax=Cellulomonas hominis TaxID=156981 RepID=A0A7Z8K1K8_9CELL|nr:DUF2075 domain-containing protein [Cellulomonas hominis]TKR26967.1 DUF2075 domain-containing protein [Cellulomonas hominis]
MEALRRSAAELIAHAGSGFSEIERALADYLSYQGVGRPGESERRSWRASLAALADDLRAAGLQDVEVLMEQRLPMTSKRADVVLAGVHPRSGDPSYVVIELKQWSRAHSWNGSLTLLDVDGARYRPVLHPALQVDGYVDYLRDFVAVLAPSPKSVVGAAYLHNASEAGVVALRAPGVGAASRLFTGQRRTDFHDFLRSRLAPTSGVQAADVLLSSRIAPSRQLLAVAADEIRQREQFRLLDEQRVAYELVMDTVRAASREDAKTVVVVAGGPGSGKSVIALSLLGQLAREGRTVTHGTGSRSFTQTLRNVAGKGSPRTRNLFAYFNSFMTAERNGLDVLILDEAHRLRTTSVNRYTRKEVRAVARPQVDELFDAARTPVFLLDQHQVVRPGEMGSVREIREHAERRGLQVLEVDLHGQFRSGGSEAWIAWILRLLGLEAGGPAVWPGDDRFAVEVAESPSDLEQRLRAKQEAGLNARMTAGYCWPWSDPRSDGTLVEDVRIGDWARPWNLRGDRSVGGAPPSALWATADGGFGQVGCVYTAQGFEYSWNGVILGPDLVWRDDRWVARREHNRDPDFRSRKTVDDETFDRLVRNVYKVLLTRGMVGTVLYSTDHETQEKLRSLISAGSRGRGEETGGVLEPAGVADPFVG